MIKDTKIPASNIIRALIYFVIVTSTIILMFATTHESAFSGLYAMLATAPWSFLFAFLLSALSPQVFDSMLPGILIIFISAGINLYLLLFGMRHAKGLFEKN